MGPDTNPRLCNHLATVTPAKDICASRMDLEFHLEHFTAAPLRCLALTLWMRELDYNLEARSRLGQPVS